MSNITVKYSNRRPVELRPAIIDYGAKKAIVALNKYGKRIDSIKQTSAGQFCSRADMYDGESSFEDALIEAGLMKVVGFIDDEYTVEVEFDSEWFATLPVYRILNESSAAADNVIEVGYEERYGNIEPVACINHGDFVWHISRFSDCGWEITGSHKTDADKHFCTGYELPLVETWREATNLERAMDEFVDAGRRIAEQYGVSFVNNLIEHVAAGYWYLEG